MNMQHLIVLIISISTSAAFSMDTIQKLENNTPTIQSLPLLGTNIRRYITGKLALYDIDNFITTNYDLSPIERVVLKIALITHIQNTNSSSTDTRIAAETYALEQLMRTRKKPVLQTQEN